MKESMTRYGILLMLTLFLLPTISSAQGFLGNLLKGINDATQEVLKEQMKPQYNWEEWVPVKKINRDGSVSKYGEDGPALRGSDHKFSFNGDIIYRHTGAIIIYDNQYHHQVYRYHHSENGNKVYFLFGDVIYPQQYKWNFSSVLILSADGNTINVLSFDNAVSKNIIAGTVYKKIIDNNIGGMYE